MATPTYDLIDSQVLSTSAASVTFSSIPATYRDLVLVVTGTTNQNNNSGIRFNSDTGSNYFGVVAEADGTSISTSAYNGAFIYGGYNYNNVGLTQSVTIYQIFDYAQTNKHKSVLMRTNKADSSVSMVAGRWANTAAINTILIHPGALQWNAGTTFYLYGIAS